MSGRNVVIGDNNTVKDSMSEDQYLQEEAESFFVNNAEQQYFIADAHQPFDVELKRVIRDFSPQEADVFLNYLNNRLIQYNNEYKNKKVYDSENLKTLQKMQLLVKKKIKVPISQIPASTNPSIQKTTVFISYSQKDRHYLNELKRHFKPIEDKVRFWDDSHIQPGQKWKEEIGIAMSEAKVAILLLSGDFFNSEFITTKEIPALLTKAINDGTTILSIFLTPYAYEHYPAIMKYQGMNAPEKPISSLNKNGREEVWIKVLRGIEGLLAE